MPLKYINTSTGTFFSEDNSSYVSTSELVANADDTEEKSVEETKSANDTKKSDE